MLDLNNTKEHFFTQMKQMTEFIPITLRLAKGYSGEEDVPYYPPEIVPQSRQNSAVPIGQGSDTAGARSATAGERNDEL